MIIRMEALDIAQIISSFAFSVQWLVFSIQGEINLMYVNKETDCYSLHFICASIYYISHIGHHSSQKNM